MTELSEIEFLVCVGTVHGSYPYSYSALRRITFVMTRLVTGKQLSESALGDLEE